MALDDDNKIGKLENYRIRNVTVHRSIQMSLNWLCSDYPRYPPFRLRHAGHAPPPPVYDLDEWWIKARRESHGPSFLSFKFRFDRLTPSRKAYVNLKWKHGWRNRRNKERLYQGLYFMLFSSSYVEIGWDCDVLRGVSTNRLPSFSLS